MILWNHKFKIVAAVLLFAVFYTQLVPMVQSIAPAEREPSFRDNFYDVTMRNDLAWIVGYYGTILESRDGGLTWKLQQSGTTEALFRVIFVDDNVGWVSGSYGTILHTRDGGASWQKQQAPVEEHLFGLNFINARQGWAVGSRGSVLATEDGGATWVDRSIGDDVILNDVGFLDADHGWAVGEFGRIYRTQDAGRKWIKQNSPIEVSPESGESRNLFRLLMTSADSAWAFGLDGVILSSQNGRQWAVSNVNDPAFASAQRYHLFSASAVDGKTWAVGERGTVLVSSIVNHDWNPAAVKAPPVSLNGIAFGNDNVGLIVGNRGVILRSDDAGKQWTKIRIGLRAAGTGAGSS